MRYVGEFVDQEWHQLVENHGEWSSRLGSESAYALPGDVITSLTEFVPADLVRNLRAKEPLISESDALSEQVFADLCQSYYQTIGIWCGERVEFWPLGDSKLSFTPSDLKDVFGMSYDARLATQLFKHDHHERLGRVGFLIFNDLFRSERDALKRCWGDLPERVKVNLNASHLFGPPEPVTKVPRRSRLEDSVAEFYDALGAFLKKWELQSLATWDLPIPQDSLTNMPAGLVARMCGADSPVDHWASQACVSSKRDLRQELQDHQMQRAAQAAIPMPQPSTAPRAGQPSNWEMAFRMWLIEEPIRRRYGSPRGLTARLLPFFAKHFDLSPDGVNRVRRIYLPHLTA